MIQRNIRYLRLSKFEKYFASFVRSKSSSRPPSTNEKFGFELSKSVHESYMEKKFGTSKSPSIMSVPCVEMPSTFCQAVEIIKTECGYQDATLYTDAHKLVRTIFSRKPPPEEGQLRDTVKTITANLTNKSLISSTPVDENGNILYDDMKKSDKARLQRSLKSRIYNWHPLNFDEYGSFTYLWGRFAPDYAALVRVFNEIKLRCSEFSPRSVFDFGSGVGSVTWAADATWPGDIYEVCNVDASAEMNTLAERLQKGGQADGPLLKRNNKTYFRQYLPASWNIRYDLVVCSRTLFELGNLKSRITTIDILWKKVAPGGFLVFVETGSFSAYVMLLEVRDYLLEICKVEREKFELESPIHVFAPCPHDNFCPLYYYKSKTPCHFSVRYHSPISVGVNTETFSYIILQKKERNEENKWPRIIEPVLRRHNHIITRTCTPAGAVRELVSTKAKQGSSCYQICKKCMRGDLLPVNIHNDVADDSLLETGESIEETRGSLLETGESIEETQGAIEASNNIEANPMSENKEVKVL